MSLATAAPALRQPGGAVHGENARQYLTFTLEDRAYGVPLLQVAEISPNRDLNRMPHMPKGVEGLLDIRGTVIPVVNLRTRLGFSTLEATEAGNILILAMAGNLIGVLVDEVRSVVTATQEEHAPAGPILAGKDGAWVSGFLVQGDQVTVLLDTALIIALGGDRVVHVSAAELDLEQKMDETLRQLIDLAPQKSQIEGGRIIPQMEAAIQHTEDEMSKVVARIERMLVEADLAFHGMVRLKQESGLGRLPGQEALLAELEKNTQAIQDQLFELLHQIQFQDIARQKLERVLNHIRGLQMAIGQKFRDIGKPA
ncbi:MAG: purine-binding chemotaxis protein CheW [Holophaga sp.]|nr:purine-binding chemotaxis protein CheW [Holophaga sp.]